MNWPIICLIAGTGCLVILTGAVVLAINRVATAFATVAKEGVKIHVDGMPEPQAIPLGIPNSTPGMPEAPVVPLSNDKVIPKEPDMEAIELKLTNKRLEASVPENLEVHGMDNLGEASLSEDDSESTVKALKNLS